MRIALPVKNNTVSALLQCEGFQFFEDDHGRILRQFFVERTGDSLASLLSLLEQYGIDALVCGALSAAEQEELLLSGIIAFPGSSGTAQEAAAQFLANTITSDPNNTCNACGYRSTCAIEPDSCPLRR